jgi:hypothetical protein
MDLKPWIKCVRLHPDVESETTAIATFAIDLGALIISDPNIPSVYRDAYSFFRVTHFTSGLKRLLEDILARLSGKEGDRVLQLRSPFGGGKSHTLAALYYAAKEREAMIKAFPEAKDLPNPGKVNIAVFDGEKFDAIQGIEINGKKIKTLWGWLAFQLGSFDLIKEHDEKRVSPGGQLIQKILGNKPNLILLDEVLKYVERGLGEKIGDSNLGRQCLEFIHTLSSEVANSRKSCLVYSLQASARESYGNVELLSILDHLTARVDAKREPVVGDEIFFILRKRFFEKVDIDVARQVAEVYAQAVRKTRLSYAQEKAEILQIEEETLKLRNRFEMAYPFHPALIDVMKEKWASIPDFQRTRGVLRFLAVVIRTLKRKGVSNAIISPGDIPLEDPDVRNSFFTEVGQREHYQSVLEADFIGPNARVKVIDKGLAKENPNLSGIEPAMQAAITILLNSFGGQVRREGIEGEMYLPGMTETEIIKTISSPFLDAVTIKGILKDLREQCLYIHFDGTRYVFKTIPNVTKTLEDESQNVSVNEIDSFLKNELEGELAGKSAIIWPKDSKNIPDGESKFTTAYLPLDLVYQDLESKSLEFLTQYGDRPRRYRNSLAIAIPDRSQVEPLKRAIKYLIAIERVKSRRRQLNLTDEQLEQLREREKTERSGFESCLKNIYSSVWLLKVDNGKTTIEKLEIGGRPIQAQNIHERLMELLTRIQGKVFESITPRKIMELMKLGIEGKTSVTTEEIKDGFFSYVGFPRLIDENVIRKAIARGAQEGLFGYVGDKSKASLVDGKFQIPKQWLRFKEGIFEDEIDLSSGLIAMPQTLPLETASVPPVPLPGPGVEQPPVTTGPQKPKPGILQKITSIRWKLKLNRQKLFKSFNALGNLAEKCQEINLTVEAKSDEGIDPNWLRNAVKEPIEEADVKIEEIDG